MAVAESLKELQGKVVSVISGDGDYRGDHLLSRRLSSCGGHKVGDGYIHPHSINKIVPRNYAGSDAMIFLERGYDLEGRR